MTTTVQVIHDNEYRTIYAAPVTLRQIETAGVSLDSRFGINDAEHTEMLDDPNLLRVTFGVTVDYQDVSTGPDAERVTPKAVFGIEALSARLADRQPQWQPCGAVEFHRRSNAVENAYRIEMLVRSIVGEQELRRILDEAAKPHQEAIDEFQQDNAD